MDEMKLVLNTKNVRKVAFAVGFGLTLGQFAGGCVKAVFNSFAAACLKTMAVKGDEVAQEYCDKRGIKYETKESSNEQS